MKDLYNLRVAAVLNNYQVVVNAGTEDGIKNGMTFLVYALGNEIIDPETKKSLGNLEVVRGLIHVGHLQPTMFVGNSDFPDHVSKFLASPAAGISAAMGNAGGPKMLISAKSGDFVRRVS